MQQLSRTCTQELYLCDAPTLGERARQESIKVRLDTMRHMLSERSDSIKRVDVCLESDDPPALHAFRVALQVLPTGSVKRLKIRHGGQNDLNTVPSLLAAGSGIANGLETLDIVVMVGKLGFDCKEHRFPANPVAVGSHFEQLAYATTKLCAFQFKVLDLAPGRRWDDRSQRRIKKLLAAVVQIRSLQSCVIDMPYLSTLAEVIRDPQDPPIWRPSFLELNCDPKPENPLSPYEYPPFYRILDVGSASIVHLVLQDVRHNDVDICTNQPALGLLHFPKLFQIELEATFDESFQDFTSPEFLRLVDPRTPVHRISSQFVTPGLVAELRRFVQAQPTRTLKMVAIRGDNPNEEVEELERQPRLDLQRWCEREEIHLDLE